MLTFSLYDDTKNDWVSFCPQFVSHVVMGWRQGRKVATISMQNGDSFTVVDDDRTVEDKIRRGAGFTDGN